MTFEEMRDVRKQAGSIWGLRVAIGLEFVAARQAYLNCSIIFAPTGRLVALAGLDRGGTLALASIYLTTIPAMAYQQYLFF